MDAGRLQQAIELYDRFTHEGMDRRDFFARMTLIAGSAAAASSLIGAIAASAAAAAIVPADDKRLTTRTMTFDNPPGYKAYVAEPRTRSLKATVLVVHENRGLNDHIRDVARRIGLEGFRAVAPDFLSLSGGTPADEDAARDAIGKLDLAKVTSDAVAMLENIQFNLHAEAKERLQTNIRRDVTDLKAHFAGDDKFVGWAEVQWSRPSGAALDGIVEQLKALKLTMRNAPLDAAPADGACFFTGEPAVERVLIGRTY